MQDRDSAQRARPLASRIERPPLQQTVSDSPLQHTVSDSLLSVLTLSHCSRTAVDLSVTLHVCPSPHCVPLSHSMMALCVSRAPCVLLTCESATRPDSVPFESHYKRPRDQRSDQSSQIGLHEHTQRACHHIKGFKNIHSMRITTSKD